MEKLIKLTVMVSFAKELLGNPERKRRSISIRLAFVLAAATQLHTLIRATLFIKQPLKQTGVQLISNNIKLR